MAGRLGAMRIPFDSLCLRAVVREIRREIGASVRRTVQARPGELRIQFFNDGEAWLLISTDADFARAHFVTRRAPAPKEQPPFVLELRKRLEDGVLADVRQRGFDRVLELEIATPKGVHLLVAELMGRHSNVMLLDPQRNVVSAMKWVGAAKSRRTVLPGKPYVPPPFESRRPLWMAKPGDDLRAFEGASPFLLKLIAAQPDLLAALPDLSDPVYSHGNGAYPTSVSPLGLPAVKRDSLSIGLEEHFSLAEERRDIERARASLLTQLERVRLARELALSELAQAADAAARAAELQMLGELILAFQTSIPVGASALDVVGYDGRPVALTLDPDRTPVENAQRFFARAKRAKAGAGEVAEQQTRLSADLQALEVVIGTVEASDSIQELDTAREVAAARRWLHAQPPPNRAKEDRPYEGHAVRELLAPGGWKVLYGDNATSNDYLTTRVAKPNDWWLHVRGNTSAHVVILTHNQPERVPREALLFAAKVAVEKSVAKHASHVPVDYTLKKYVRKPRGSAPGAALYEREKTLHI